MRSDSGETLRLVVLPPTVGQNENEGEGRLSLSLGSVHRQQLPVLGPRTRTERQCIQALICRSIGLRRVCEGFCSTVASGRREPESRAEAKEGASLREGLSLNRRMNLAVTSSATTFWLGQAANLFTWKREMRPCHPAHDQARVCITRAAESRAYNNMVVSIM